MALPPSPSQRVHLARRFALSLAAATIAASVVTACGFRLRGNQTYSFGSIAITPYTGSAVAQELSRSFGSTVQVVQAHEPGKLAQLLLGVGKEQREKVVVGVNSSGQVREFQLRMRVTLRLSTVKGKVLIEDAEISQQREISFNETVVLAKEAEEALLYRDMQSDIVQQILRRLAKVQADQLD
jgi:LPS-assembly lipoprotein